MYKKCDFAPVCTFQKGFCKFCCTFFSLCFCPFFCGLRSRAPKKKELKEDDEDGFDEMEEAIEAANAADLAEIEAEGAKKPKR